MGCDREFSLGLDFFDELRFFLTFSLLDVPLISRGLWPGISRIPEGLKFFLTFVRLDVP